MPKESKYSQVTPKKKRNKITPFSDSFGEESKIKNLKSQDLQMQFTLSDQNEGPLGRKNSYEGEEELGFDEVSSSHPNAHILFQSVKEKAVQGSNLFNELKENNRYNTKRD